MQGQAGKMTMMAPKVTLSLKFALLTLGLALLALDYRRQEGDEGAFVVLSLLGSLFLISGSLAVVRKVSKRTLLSVAPFMAFLVINMVSAMFRGDQLRFILSSNLPLVFLIASALVVSNIATTERELEKLLLIVAATGILAGVFKLAFGFLYFGLDATTVRYQILAASLPILFAYAITSMSLSPRRLYIIGLAIVITAVGLSVTRTYIAVLLIAPLVIFFSLPKCLGSRRMWLIFRIFIVASLALAVLSIAAPDVAERWLLRFTESPGGYDSTALSRIAEANYQIDRLREDWTGLLFGFGVTAGTGFSGRAAEILAALSEGGVSGMVWRGSGYGHNTYVGAVFVGGILAGGALIYSMFRRVVLEAFALRASQLPVSSAELFVRILGVSTLAAFLGMGVLSGIFGDRGTAAYFGIAWGLSIIRLPSGSRPLSSQSNGRLQ